MEVRIAEGRAMWTPRAGTACSYARHGMLPVTRGTLVAWRPPSLEQGSTRVAHFSTARNQRDQESLGEVCLQSKQRKASRQCLAMAGPTAILPVAFVTKQADSLEVLALTASGVRKLAERLCPLRNVVPFLCFATGAKHSTSDHAVIC